MKRNLAQIHPDKARVLRAKRRVDNQDEDQQLEEKFIANPAQTIKRAEKNIKKSQKNLEKQIKYYGHVIEPFNMKNQKHMGELDDSGFFVFNKKSNQIKDAWLDSLQMRDEQELLAGIQKKVLQNKSAEPVKAINEADQEQQNDDVMSSQSDDEKFADPQVLKKRKLQKQELIIEKQPQMQPFEIKYLLSQLLPNKMNCANYLKQLKPQKKPIFKKNVRKSEIQQEKNLVSKQDQQQYERILTLCNLYIQLTGDHEIMIVTKQKLTKEIEQIQMKNAPIISQSKPDQADDQDAIF